MHASERFLACYATWQRVSRSCRIQSLHIQGRMLMSLTWTWCINTMQTKDRRIPKGHIDDDSQETGRVQANETALACYVTWQHASMLCGNQSLHACRHRLPPMWHKITIQGVMRISSMLVVRQKLGAHEPGDPDMSASHHDTFCIFECRGKNAVLAHSLSN